MYFYWEESQATSSAGTRAWTRSREQHAAGGRGAGEIPAQVDHIPCSAAEGGRCATEAQAVQRNPAPAQPSSSGRRGGAGAGSVERGLLLAGRAEALQQCGLRGLVPRVLRKGMATVICWVAYEYLIDKEDAIMAK